MSQRDCDLASSLAYSPIEYIPPKQQVLSFGFPFSEELPYEAIGDVSGPADGEVDQIASDLRRVAFKKSARKLPHGKAQELQLEELEKMILASVPPVTRREYVKPDIKVRRVKLQGEIESAEVEELQRGVIADECRERDGIVLKKKTRDDEDWAGDSVTLDPEELVDQARAKLTSLLRDANLETDVDIDVDVDMDADLTMSNDSSWRPVAEGLRRLWKSDSMGQLPGDALNVLEQSAQRCVSTSLDVSDPATAREAVYAASALVMLLSNSVKRKMHGEAPLYTVFDLLNNLQKELLPLYERQNNSQAPTSEMRALLHHTSALITLLKNFLVDTTVSDTLVTRLEYFALAFILAQAPKNELLAPSLEKLRSASSELLLAICKKYADQSRFVVSEIFSGLTKSTTDSLFRLSRGSSVQLISLFLVQLVQLHDCTGFKFDEAYWGMIGSRASARASQRKLVQQISKDFVELVDEKTTLSRGIASDIANTFISRAAVMNPGLKRSLTRIVEDLLVMLEYPEYSGAETILTFLINVLLNTKGGVAIESFELELLGSIGAAIFDIRLKLKSPGGTKDTKEEQLDKLNDLFLRALHQLKGHDGFWYFYTKCLHALHAFEADEDLAKKARRMILDFTQILNGNYKVLQDPGLSNPYGHILALSELTLKFPEYLAAITQGLGSPQIKIRSAAVRNLSLLMDRQPSLMASSAVKMVIAQRLSEPAASVSESILGLLSRFLERNPRMVPEFSSLVISKIDDRSVAVRKKSIGLASYMYETTPSTRRAISRKFLQRIDDEDPNVTRLAASHLLDYWLSGNYPLNDVLDAILPIDNYFERFLREQAFESHDAYSVRHALSQLVEGVVERITEDDGSEEPAEDDVGKYMAFLAVVAKCDCKLISQDQLLSLQPYLADNNNRSSGRSYHTLRLFSIALPHMITLNPRFVEDCGVSLLSRVTRFNAHELPLAMKCIWVLSTRNRTTERIAKAAANCLRMLLLRRSDAEVLRLIFLAGSFGSVCNFESHRELFAKLPPKESVTAFVVRHILPFYRSSESEKIRMAALKNLLAVCVTHPRLFLTKDVLKIMDESVESGNQSAQDIVTDSLSLFLQNEEDAARERNGYGAKRSSDKVDIAAFHGETIECLHDSICASLVQRYLRQVLHACTVRKNAQKAVEFLRLVTKLGFANPKLSFPTIVALETSDIPYVRRVALEIHRYLLDKFESLIEPAYPKALKYAVKYRHRHSDDVNADRTFIQNFAQVTTSIGGNGGGRRMFGFYESVADTFKIIKVDKLLSSKDKSDFAKHYIEFIAHNLNETDLATQEEVLVLASSANRVISSQIPNLMAVEDYEDREKVDLIGRALLSLCKLEDNLLEMYGLSEKVLLKYQQSPKAKEFRKPAKKGEQKPLDLDEASTEQVIEALTYYA